MTKMYHKGPRALAVKCLVEVENGAFSNLVFKQRIENTKMDARDLQFLARLFYGTIERTVTLDYILSQYLKDGIAKLDPEVRAILRSGLYQCLYMGSVPVSAAVNESVRLCAGFGKKSAAGLVNAVLRKASGFDISAIDDIDNEITRVSVKYSVCPELAQLFLEQYGGEAAEILAATLKRAPAAVRVNTLKTNAEELINQLCGEDIEAREAWVKDALTITSGRYPASQAVKNGSMRVQSLAAQYVVQLLAPKPGETMLDMCAAPGGKSLTAAQMMENRGSITALDIHENRLKLIDEQAEREGVSIVSTCLADAAEYRGGTLFDAVLCDVPCSGYGEMAQKPEIRQKTTAGPELYGIQSKILKNAAGFVKKGGRLVYSTCTLDKRENEEIVTAFLSENQGFKAVLPANLSQHVTICGEYLKFVPKEENSEGFFIATLERM